MRLSERDWEMDAAVYAVDLACHKLDSELGRLRFDNAAIENLHLPKMRMLLNDLHVLAYGTMEEAEVAACAAIDRRKQALEGMKPFDGKIDLEKYSKALRDTSCLAWDWEKIMSVDGRPCATGTFVYLAAQEEENRNV